MQRTFAIIERELRRFRRSPMLIVMSMIFPVVQLVVLLVEALLLGYRFDGAHLLTAAGAMLLATVAFAGLGMLLAGTLPALTTLAAASAAVQAIARAWEVEPKSLQELHA